MVKLSLISPKGNQGVRYFPYQGYLGLTSVKVEGLVRTNIEQDGKPILAKDITVAVRCYEARHSRLGVLHMNVLSEHTTTLWQKDDGQEWSEIGDSEHQFRLSVPSSVSAPSTALYFQEYRIFWRVEAVLNHIPIAGVGFRQMKYFELALVRYDSPFYHSPPITPLTPPSSTHLTSQTTKSRGLPLRYRVLVPPSPIGPLDIVTIQVIVQPLDPTMSVRSASALVERRIHLAEVTSITQPSMDSTPPPSVSNETTPFIHYPSVGPSLQDLHAPSSTSLFSDCSSRPILQNYSHAPDDVMSWPHNDRTITHIFAHTESSARFMRDSGGAWRQNLTFSWPETKSNSRWSVGETLQTEVASVKFFLRVKLVVSSSACSAESVELEDRELTIVSINDSQRQIALSRYSEWTQASSARPKSKSPRRTKRDRLTGQLPSPPRSPVLPTSDVTPSSAPVDDPRQGHTYKFSSASAPHPQNEVRPKAKRTRRPHTSAGPRDKPEGLFSMQNYEPVPSTTQLVTASLRPETAHPTPTTAISRRSSRYNLRQIWPEVPRLGLRSSSNDSSPEGAKHCDSAHVRERMDQVDVRAWEEELARIEVASRKSSAGMFSFITQRKRSAGLLPALRTFLPAEG
ncbi:hypothetical protein ID866_3937 [Astraeus odoratus]|nr:hypothetical protein ID866_3937 [Astraeus odoratus]